MNLFADTEALPSYIDPELWGDFITNRKAIKKPMSEVAKNRMLRKLGRWHTAGIDVNECLERSIINSWQDVYEPKQPEQPDPVGELTSRGYRLHYS